MNVQSSIALRVLRETRRVAHRTAFAGSRRVPARGRRPRCGPWPCARCDGFRDAIALMLWLSLAAL